MNCDSAAYTGRSHAICEDYARVRLGDGFPYAIVSDGCSSSKDSDIGARVLSTCMETNITQKVIRHPMSIADIMWKEDVYINQLLRMMQQSKELMGLDNESMDATLIIARVDAERDICSIRFYGDGLAAIGYENGLINVYEVLYPSGYPFYLNYCLDDNRFSAWKDYYEISGCVVNEYRIVDGKCDFGYTSSNQHINDNCCESYIITENLHEIKFISVMSDGVSSFFKFNIDETSKTTEVVPLTTVLPRLLAFKNFQGEFVKRRMQRFIKDTEKDLWQHNDDLSMAAIHIGN